MPNFDWDPNKNKSNQEKHKIAFEDASDVFNDKNRLEYVSDKQGETRYLTVGKAFQAIISVVYTPINLIIRIISARRASQDERRAYLSNKLTSKEDDES
ncbi:MAG: BrnT family toxin [Phycisphaerae bacterium]|nr:BrnT family toxin [Saprospiraceae bacterium]